MQWKVLRWNLINSLVFHWGHQHFLTSNLMQMLEIAYILFYVRLQYINPVVKAHQPSADRCDRL